MARASTNEEMFKKILAPEIVASALPS